MKVETMFSCFAYYEITEPIVVSSYTVDPQKYGLNYFII